MSVDEPLTGEAVNALVPELWREEIPVVRMIEGELCGFQRFASTAALLVNVQFDGGFYDYDRRYCYARAHEALFALLTWHGAGDPPGHWIKEKGFLESRRCNCLFFL
jgi:hypothetical protein